MGFRDAIRRFFAPPESNELAKSKQVQQAVNAFNRVQRATYDAARSGNDLDRYWANSDAFDADSAHSRDVRHKLIRRSRYEAANNGYSDGIAQTYANDLVGVGPALRMLTGSVNFNQLVKREFYAWGQAIGLHEKLWTMAHAKHVDGESFGVIRRNPRVRHPIKVDLVLYEAEQCQTPYLPFDEPGYIDGIKFDEYGNPLWYDILHEHPGTSGSLLFDLKPEQVPAEFVLHWFKMRRAGQHRGVPECASTLNLGAAFRRLREANLTTAEKVAAWTLFLKTQFQPSEEDAQAVEQMATEEINYGMMTALPNTVEPFQLSAEHPGPQYDAFHRSLLNEQGRAANMPFNKTACDSSSYNYASGRLDHQTYYASLDVDRERGNSRVLDPLFTAWFDAAIRTFGWLGRNPEAVGASARVHIWDWPKHRVADVESEANANETRLKSGQIGLHSLYSDAGMDLDDEIAEMATTFAVTPEVIRQRLLDVILPPPKQLAGGSGESANLNDAVASTLRTLLRRGELSKVNGNGVHHAN